MRKYIRFEPQGASPDSGFKAKENRSAKALRVNFPPSHSRSRISGLCFFLLVILWSASAGADFVGPLVTDPADPIDTKKFSLEITPSLFIKQGTFDENGSLRYSSSGDQAYRFTANIKSTYGIFENAEVSALVPVSYNWVGQAESSAQAGGLGDILLGFKYRFLENDKKSLRPSVSAVAKIKFPTGKYDNLSRENLGTDLTGNGSYEYLLGLNVSKFWETWGLHANLWYDWVAETNTDGIRTKPGNVIYYNVAAEYALTKNLTALLELNGWSQGLPAKNGQDVDKSEAYSLSLVPGLEWRLTESFYTIFGISFTVRGKNTDYGLTPTLLMNYTF